MITVYVIYSEKFDRLYIGLTIDVKRRLEEHNKGINKSTKYFCPWRIIYTEEVENMVEARKREKKLKTSSARLKIRKTYLGK